jgi:hypothetical protein
VGPARAEDAESRCSCSATPQQPVILHRHHVEEDDEFEFELPEHTSNAVPCARLASLGRVLRQLTTIYCSNCTESIPKQEMTLYKPACRNR